MKYDLRLLRSRGLFLSVEGKYIPPGAMGRSHCTARHCTYAAMAGGQRMTRGAGFTLLEMLIAILLTALIGLVLFSSYRNVLESRDHAKAWVAAQ